MRILKFIIVIFFLSYSFNGWCARLKDLSRIQEEKPVTLIGYGIVVGLGGTGDSSRNKMTVQSLKNTLSNFGLALDEKDIISRNVAAVMVTSKISAFAEKGDQFDIVVSSIGDARSLAGGTLVMTPLYGADERIYAFAQGQLTVGGYEVEQDANSYRKNHQTVGKSVKGATLERALETGYDASETIDIILDNPDYTTASKIVEAIRTQTGNPNVSAVHPGKVVVHVPPQAERIGYVAKLEGVLVTPDKISNVVINEKTGTIVAGSDVVISAISVAHGSLKIEIDTRYSVSQPSNGVFRSSGVQTAVVPETTISVTEDLGRPISMAEGTTVSELVTALNKINVSTRDIISILQSIKTAGALHANLIIE